jgi:hypothetical protein
MRKTPCWAWLVLAALPLQAADPRLLNLARPDVNFLVGIQVAKVAHSPIVQKALEKATESPEDWMGLLRQMGPNPLADIEEVLIAGRVEPNASKEDVGKDALLLVRGWFEDGSLVQALCAAGCQTEPHRDFEIIRVEKQNAKDPGYFVVFDGQYAAAGDRDAVLGAIDRWTKETQSIFKPQMQSSIDRLSSQHIWIAARGPFQQADLEAEVPMAAAFSKVSGFGLGFTLDDDVSLQLEVESLTEQDAAQLYGMAQGLLALATAQGQQQSESQAFNPFQALQLRQDSRFLRATLKIPQSELTKQIETQVAEAHRQEQAEKTRSQGMVSRKSAPRHSSIRVYGLESKPVEYPLAPQ